MAAGWSPETGVSVKPDANRTFSVISSWLVKASEADCRAPEPERTVLREHREQWRFHHHTLLPGRLWVVLVAKPPDAQCTLFPSPTGSCRRSHPT